MKESDMISFIYGGMNSFYGRQGRVSLCTNHDRELDFTVESYRSTQGRRCSLSGRCRCHLLLKRFKRPHNDYSPPRLMVSSKHTFNITSELPLICVSKVYNMFSELFNKFRKSLSASISGFDVVSKTQPVDSDRRHIIGERKHTVFVRQG